MINKNCLVLKFDTISNFNFGGNHLEDIMAPRPKISKKSRLIKFYYVPATSACSSKGIFAAATNSTKQTNRQVVRTINQSIFNIISIATTFGIKK
jgi:hypothetical protein